MVSTIKFVRKYDISDEIADFRQRPDTTDTIWTAIRKSKTETDAKLRIIAEMNKQIRLATTVISKLTK